MLDPVLARPVTRRALLGAGAAAATTVALGGCSPGSAPAPAAEAAKVAVPTFRPYTGVEPALPALPNGTSPYFVSYPSQPPQFITDKPGRGGRVTILTMLNKQPVPMAQNSWWQMLNQAIGAELDMTGVPAGDYPAKFQTVMAGGDIPDLVSILPSSTPRLADVLEAKFADLSEYLAGDAVLDFPSLANQPAGTWEACRFGGRIRAIPIHRFALKHGMLVREDIATQRGLNPAPTSGEEFRALLRGLAQPGRKAYAVNTVTALVMQVAEMMGAPNEWRLDGDNLVKDVESEQFTDALEFARQCWAEQLIHPTALELNASLQTQNYFNAGTAPLILGGATLAGNAYEARRADPAARSTFVSMPKWDGSGPAARWVGNGAPFLAAVKQGSPERVREILGVVNWIAAPWGTKECHTFRYGVAGKHHVLDDAGVPKRTEFGEAEYPGPGLMYLGAPPMIHYIPQAPDYAKLEYLYEAAAMEHTVPLPTSGLESPTDQTKSAMLTKLLTSAQVDIVTGRQPVSSWAETLQSWRTKGGEEIRAEYRAALQAT